MTDFVIKTMHRNKDAYDIYDGIITLLSCPHRSTMVSVRWSRPILTLNRMLHFQRMRSLTMRITHFGANVPVRWAQFRIHHPVSLGAALLVIALSSLAFWRNQPDGLFNGGDPSCSFADRKPRARHEPFIERGLLSLEVFSTMTRTMPRPSGPQPAAHHDLDAPNASASCAPARAGR